MSAEAWTIMVALFAVVVVLIVSSPYIHEFLDELN